jgi:oligopeptide/dipeptide ABC transporter ATP-binding protein
MSDASGLAGGGDEVDPTPISSKRPIVEVEDLHVHFHIGRGVLTRRGTDRVRAIDGVTLAIDRGTTLGVVGESGSGKSTLARVIMGMVTPTSGKVTVGGGVMFPKGDRTVRSASVVQIVFQDPFSSLDPRMSVGNIIAEPLTLSKPAIGSRERRERVADLLERVGLAQASAQAYPHQFSGGQQQRIAIARALAPNPDLLVLDEPTSALDVSVRAQILSLLRELQADLDLSYLIISHDLLTVAQMATTVGVMYLGRIVESGPVRQIFRSPAHPYTQALLTSIPDEDAPSTPRLAPDYEIPSPIDMPTGCRFKSGCMLRRELGNPPDCDRVDPPLVSLPSGQATACHFPEEALRVSSLER